MSIDPRLILPPGGATKPLVDIADLKRRLSALETLKTTIGDGTITGGQISGGTITASNIQAGTIDASLIAAGAINAGHIAANSITSDSIVANTIQASDIMAGTITATEIAAATILGANIQASTITANNIATGTLTGVLIASATITGDKIVAATITADKINVSNLAAISANLGTVTAGTIQGATFQTAAANPRIVINSSGISAADSAGNINFSVDAATGKIVTLAGIGTANLLYDSGFEQASPALGTLAFTNCTGARVTTQKKYNNASAQITATSAANLTVATNAFFRPAISPNKSYVFSAWVRNNTTTRNVRAEMQFYNGGATTGSNNVGTTVAEVSGQWVRVEVSGTAPSNATNAHVQVVVVSAANGEIHYTDAWQVQEGDFATGYGARPEEILTDMVEGGGGAGHIKDNTIIAGDLLAHTITANEIAASTITAVEIAALTITAGKIVSGTITATQIAAGTITADRMNVTTLSAITADMGTITAGTITGATLRTAASGSRVQINTSGLSAFNGTTETLRIASSDGSSSLLLSTVGTTSGVAQPSNPTAATNTTGWSDITGGGGVFTRTTTAGQFDSSPAGFKLDGGSQGTTWSGTWTAGKRYQLSMRIKASGTANFVPANETNYLLVRFGEDFSSRPGPTYDYVYTFIDGNRIDYNQFQTFTLDWVPQATFTGFVILDIYAALKNAFNTLVSLYIDSIQILDVDVAAVNQLQFQDTIPGSKRGGVFGYKTTGNNNSNAVLEAAPLGSDSAGSSATLRIQPPGAGRRAELVLQDNPGLLLGKRGLVFRYQDDTDPTQYNERLLLDSRGSSSFITAKGYHCFIGRFSGGAQGISDSTTTTVGMNSTIYDVAENGQQQGLVNPNEITCVKSGLYYINGAVQWASGATTGTRRDLYLIQRYFGTVNTKIISRISMPTGVVHANLSTVADLGAGDSIYLAVYQDTGGTININQNGATDWSICVLKTSRIGASHDDAFADLL